MTENKVVIILGTTSSGKTRLAVKLAKKFNGEIISADSRQVYRGMDIGTGKDLKEYGRVPYHLIDIISPQRQLTVSDWQKLANEKIKDILKRNKLPIVCGGTGLYISALAEGYQFQALGTKNLRVRKNLNKLSLEQLLARLKKIDLATYKIIDQNNRRRVQRALEIYYQTGVTKSQQIGRVKPEWQFLKIGLTFPKDQLNKKIDQRLKKRLEQEGMAREVARLHQAGVSWRRLEEFGLEYRWLAYYWQKKIDYNEMVKQLAKAIKNFAKRQLTWFKKDQSIKWLNDYSDIEKAVKKFIK